MEFAAECVKRVLCAWILLVLANFVYRSGTIILIFKANIDHEICCLFSDELSDGVDQTGGNGLRGI